jgi:hypothetical protein
MSMEKISSPLPTNISPSSSRFAREVGPKFNPLGRKPKKPKPPALPPPAINDLNDITQEELQSSAKELAVLLQNMMKGADCPAGP